MARNFIPKSDIPISQQEPNPLPDRKALDDIVFDALGLTESETSGARASCNCSKKGGGFIRSSKRPAQAAYQFPKI